MNTKDYNSCVLNYSDSLYRFCLSTARKRDEAQDLVQIAFEKLWIHRDDIDLEKVKSWLFTVAMRTFIDGERRKQTEAKILSIRDTESASYDNYEAVDMLDQCLEHLSEKQKQLVLLRDYEGYSYEEIAEIAGLSLSQVKVYIFRARKKLKAVIGKLEKIN